MSACLVSVWLLLTSEESIPGAFVWAFLPFPIQAAGIDNRSNAQNMNGHRASVWPVTRKRRIVICYTLRLLAVTLLTPSIGLYQSIATDVETNHESKHLLGVMPNYRTSPSLSDYQPLTARQKFGVSA
jgi:hypothetical protein